MHDKTFLDVQPDWEKIVAKGFDNYDSLTKDERTWFNIGVLIAAVTNGGTIGFYCNYGAENHKETIDDLNSLGFVDLSAILIRVNSFFPNSIPPKDMMERNQVIASWPEFEYDDLLEEFDKKFLDRHEELENELLAFILSKNLSS